MAMFCKISLQMSGLLFAGMLLQICLAQTTQIEDHHSDAMIIDNVTSYMEVLRTEIELLGTEIGEIQAGTELPTLNLSLWEMDLDGEGVDYWQWQPNMSLWWSILQLLSAIIGLIGNAIVILVVFQKKVKWSSTDTLIGSLAVADLLTSMFLIPIPDVVNVPSTWVGELYCKGVYTARCMWTSVSASVFTLTLISVERFIGITYPFRFRELFSQRLTALYILIVWILAIILNSFAFFIFHVDANTHGCIVIFPTDNGGEVLGIVSFFLILVLPTVVMLTTQGLTAYQLHLEASRFQGENNQKLKSNPTVRLIIAKKRVIKLLFIINITFIVCWAPNQSAYLAFNHGFLDYTYLCGPLFRGLVVLAFCNSCANPIIYTIQHKQFRVAIKAFFTGNSKASKSPVFMKPT